jgi:hypothetical protein
MVRTCAEDYGGQVFAYTSLPHGRVEVPLTEVRSVDTTAAH